MSYVSRLVLSALVLVLGAVWLVPAVSAVSLAPTQDELLEIVGKPQPRITIPGVSFSDPVVKNEEGRKYLYIPFLGNYISAVYKYGVVAVSVAAVIMVIVSGVIWTTSAGNSEQVNKAKSTLSKAIIGLLIAVGSYTILFTINPELVIFKSLRVRYVETVDLPLESVLTDVYGGDPSLDPDLFNEDVQITDGQYRQKMMAACGAKDGFSLGSYEQRVDRLVNIVKVWKEVGVDQGGAVYIRGGASNCGYFSIDPGWIINVMANVVEKDGTQANLSGACLSAAQQASQLPYAKRGAIGVMFKDQCAKKDQQWWTEYKRLAVDRAKKAGMLCGDCASTLRALYFQCFDGGNYRGNVQQRFDPYRAGRQIVTKGGTCKTRGADPKDKRYVFQLSNPGPSDISEVVGKLRFGDVIGWQRGDVGHVLMYTGGKGLDFEIMEMGGGGRGDVSGAGGALAQKNAQIPWKISGMRVHGSAEKYLQDIAKSQDKCIFAWRPLLD